jgi:hypothetical protein
MEEVVDVEEVVGKSESSRNIHRVAVTNLIDHKNIYNSD